MEELMKDIEKDLNETNQEMRNVYDLTLKIMEKKDNLSKFIIRCFLVITVILLLINGYLGYTLATTTVLDTNETNQEGVYNFVDSEGNMVSSDLSLEEMKELIELNGEN